MFYWFIPEATLMNPFFSLIFIHAILPILIKKILTITKVFVCMTFQ